MLLNFETVSKLINEGKLLHIAGSQAMLQKLPKGKWIGGSTEYFMGKNGCKISDDHFHVFEFSNNFKIKSYDTADLKNIAKDGFDSGFSIVIIPFDSDVHIEYAQNAPTYQGLFMKNIVGWISGLNLSKEGQTPIAINGMTGEVFQDKAVVLHLDGGGKMFCINIINIFSQDESSPVIEFSKEGFNADKCLVDGKETKLAEYIEKNKIDTKMPLVGNYSGAGINISFKKIENDIVYFYAPVFKGIKYRIANNTSDYVKAFNERITEIKDANIVFSCNCILNFLYGELEGKSIGSFTGPVTFGEVAYQLVNQTLVYVTLVGN